MKSLSLRSIQLAPSLTVAIDTKAKEMIAQGLDVVALGAGEPDFDTPERIKQAAVEAIAHNKTRYTAPDGILALKEAVCRKLNRENQLTYKPSQIVISSGAKHCVFNALLALVNPGDEVIIPAPYWVTYPELVRFLGGVPVILEARIEQGFRITPKQLEDAITPRTKLLILNSPNNPSGAVYPEATLQEFARILVHHDIYCLSDEIYEHMIYEGKHVSIASFGAEIQERTIVVNGVSKSYAMTGWRIGYLAASAPIAQAIAKIQGQATHHPSNISQWASIEALDHGREFYTQMREAFRKRRQFVLHELAQIPLVQAPNPEGAFYAFPQTSLYYGKKRPDGTIIHGSLDLCNWLLESQKLAIIPGAAFGMDDCVRLSYAASDTLLHKALERFKAGLAELT
jgi:aspartate aminotransferase